MEADLVSVIIPTYNRAYCIANAVDSVRSQTHQNLEIIVVDDGSTDGTAALMKERYAADPRVRYLPQRNGGVSKARNTGLRAATGDYIALLDSDDAWRPWKVELQLRGLAQYPEAGMIWTEMAAIDAEGRLLHERYLHKMYSAYRLYSAETLFTRSRPVAEFMPGVPGSAGTKLYFGDIFSPMVMGNLVHTSTVLLRRDRQRAVGEFDEGFKRSGEDYQFHLRTCRLGPVAFVDVACIEYRVGAEDQLTHERYRVDIARNALTTVSSVVERDGARISLPPGMLDERLAALHQRVGMASLDAGNHAEARRELSASLRRQPGQPRVLMFLIFACLPAFALTAARGVFRALKKLRPAAGEAAAP